MILAEPTGTRTSALHKIGRVLSVISGFLCQDLKLARHQSVVGLIIVVGRGISLLTKLLLVQNGNQEKC